MAINTNQLYCYCHTKHNLYILYLIFGYERYQSFRSKEKSYVCTDSICALVIAHEITTAAGKSTY